MQIKIIGFGENATLKLLRTHTVRDNRDKMGTSHAKTNSAVRNKLSLKNHSNTLRDSTGK